MLHIDSLGRGMWRWSCDICGRRQVLTSQAEALRIGIAHEHRPAPKQEETSSMDKVTPYLKALIGALVAGLGVLALALDDEQVTSGEWVNIAIATLTALGAVWAIPNLDPKARHQNESVQPPQRGEVGESALHVAVLVLVLLVIVWFVASIAR